MHTRANPISTQYHKTRHNQRTPEQTRSQPDTTKHGTTTANAHWSRPRYQRTPKDNHDPCPIPCSFWFRSTRPAKRKGLWWLGLWDRRWRKGSAFGLMRSTMERMVCSGWACEIGNGENGRRLGLWDRWWREGLEEERRDWEVVRREIRRMKWRKNKK